MVAASSAPGDPTLNLGTAAQQQVHEITFSTISWAMFTWDATNGVLSGHIFQMINHSPGAIIYQLPPPSSILFNFLFFQLIEFWRKRERDRENIDLLFHLFMYSSVDCCMCPDWGLNPQPWCLRQCLNHLSYSSRTIFNFQFQFFHINVPFIMSFLFAFLTQNN